MIKITSLNKIYRSKKRKKCHALNDINLTLPDAGLVFVLGKSGSGKSTMLNLIGGLDSMTSGQIEVDGNNLSAFREGAFCNYRNTHIGFIFQDYHLIDELTVYENIVLSLNLRRIEDEDKVKAALEKVDLAGYEERYPSELSGGERQRVAIARAIVKNPRVILADEPTGNLDTNTAKSIVELLKELSRDCLILIVSHNVNDANAYADRIIELAKGKIISDKSKNPDFADEVMLNNGTLVYPNGLALSEKDVDLINNNKDANIVIKKDKFISTPENKSVAKKVKIENKNLSLGKELKLSGKFLKNKALAIAVSSFMVAVIMIIMALSQTIIAFNSNEIVASEMVKSQQTSLLMNKVVDEETKVKLAAQYCVMIGEGDIQAFYDAGYKGDIYPVLSYTLYISSIGTTWGITNTRFQGAYMAETFGTMVVDEEFLTEKFGEYEYAARVDKFLDFGVIIPDYVADSIIKLNSKYFDKTYDQLLGEYYFSAFTLSHCYINGIIDTGYKDRYKDLFEKLESDQAIDISEIYTDSDFQAFSNEIYASLGYCYTTNPDFASDFMNSHLASFPPHYTLVFNDIFEYNTRSYPYVINSTYLSSYLDTAHALANKWIYTTEVPEIPEGARYIRVAFNDAIDDVHGVYNEVTTLSCAKLRFDDSELIPIEVMNALSADGQNGVFLNASDGSVVLRNDIGTGKSGDTCTYLSDFIEIPDGAEITEFASITQAGYSYCAFYDENKEIVSTVCLPKGRELDPQTVYMSLNKYNEIFGTEYMAKDIDTFIPHTVKMTHYDYNDVDKQNPLFSVEITIAGLREASRTMDVSEDICELFAKDWIRVYSLYFDGIDGIGGVLDISDEMNYEHQSYAIEGIHTMTEAVDVFVPIFELVAIILCVGVVFVLMNFSTKMIKDKMHEIGILKALGTKNSSIGVVFGLQVILIALFTCILATVGYYLFIDLANDVLIESLKRLAPSKIVLDLDFLTFKPKVAIENCILIFALALISLILPMIKIKSIKPVKIIKAKE